LAWQPAIIRHRTDVHGAFLQEWQHLPADEPHSDDDDDDGDKVILDVTGPTSRYIRKKSFK